MAYDIYLSPPFLSGNESERVQAAIDSNWIAPLGPEVNGFEQDVAAYTGVRAAAAVSSGTAALHLALVINGIGPGDEVVCPTFTFIASVNPVLYVGATPILIDSSADTWNLDPDLLEEYLEKRAKKGRRPKAVITVDLYGQCADYDRIEDICRRYDIILIEDAAEAAGSDYQGRKAGSFGKCGIFSFNGNKIVTSSGGGMFLSNDEDQVKRAVFLATQARDPAPHYQHSVIGYNYRMSNIVAALGRAQFAALDRRMQRRRDIFDRYRGNLGNLPGIDFMPEADYGRSNRWLTCITVEPEAYGASREDIRLKLEEHSIESRPLWKPMHLQPMFEGVEMIGGNVSEHYFDIGLCLPSGNQMSDDDVDKVSDLVKSVRD